MVVYKIDVRDVAAVVEGLVMVGLFKHRACGCANVGWRCGVVSGHPLMWFDKLTMSGNPEEEIAFSFAGMFAVRGGCSPGPLPLFSSSPR